MPTRKWTRFSAALLGLGLLACSSPKETEPPPAQQVQAPAPATSEAPAVAAEKPLGDYFDSSGLARAENGKTCFVSYATALNPGMPMLLIDPSDDPPSFQVARLGPYFKTPCQVGNNITFDEVLVGLPTFYEVELLKPDKKDLRGTWIGVPGASPGALTMSKDHQLKGDLDNDGTLERFFYCNSMEGFHYAIRSIGEGKGRQRWHVYASAGYEMEGSTCPDEAIEPVAPRPLRSGATSTP